MEYSLLKTWIQNWLSFQKINFSLINYWTQYRNNKLNCCGCIVQKIRFLLCKYLFSSLSSSTLFLFEIIHILESSNLSLT